MTLYLVRHGRPRVDRTRPAAQWDLDPAAYDAVQALRDSGRLPRAAAWYSSAESKAIATAELLTDGEIAVVDALGEHRRDAATWVEDFDAAVARAFAVPEQPAVAGWEPLAWCRDRVTAAAEAILDVHGDDDVVLVGHGTAWTVLASVLTRTPPDLDRWRGLGMPGLIVVEPVRSTR